MKTLVFINPLKPGKLDDYKKFVAEITGPRAGEYTDLLNRYGLKTAQSYCHKLGDKEFLIVIHEVEDDAGELLEKFPTSEHPFDRWFFEHILKQHNMEEVAQAEHIFTFKV